VVDFFTRSSRSGATVSTAATAA